MGGSGMKQGRYALGSKTLRGCENLKALVVEPWQVEPEMRLP
jgi:hypothetical protein